MSRDIVRIWHETAVEARALVDSGRDPMAPVELLSELYSALADDERDVADALLAEDLLSDDSGVRYDALWIVNDLAIKSAVPALQALASRLAASAELDATFELQKVGRLLQKLTDGAAQE